MTAGSGGMIASAGSGADAVDGLGTGGTLVGTGGSGGAGAATAGSGADAVTGEGTGGTLGGTEGIGSGGVGGATAGSGVLVVSDILRGAGAGLDGGSGTLGVLTVSAELMGADAGLDGAGRQLMVDAGVAVCACALRDAGAAGAVPTVDPALGLVAADLVCGAEGLGRAASARLTAVSEPGMKLMTFLASSSSSRLMNRSFCCSISCCCRLSSVAVTLATSAATCALSLTYRSMPSWNVVGASCL